MEDEESRIKHTVKEVGDGQSCLSVLFCFFETESRYVVQAGLEFELVLPQPPRILEKGAEAWQGGTHL